MNIAKEIERDLKRKIRADKKEISRLVKDLSGRETGILLRFIFAMKEAMKDGKRSIAIVKKAKHG